MAANTQPDTPSDTQTNHQARHISADEGNPTNPDQSLPPRGTPAHQQVMRHERWALLWHLDEALHKPLLALAFVWVVLLVVDFTRGLSTPLLYVTYGIWAVFVLDFLLEVIIAPNKLTYLRHHWLTAVSLVLPGLRVLTIFRALQALRIAQGARATGLLRLISSLNRGMAALSETLGRRGFGFVAAFTILVIFASAGAIEYYESPTALRSAGFSASPALSHYTDALWWSAMMITTIGSDYWPKTPEGRILTFLLALYAFAVFGYITATLASFFVRSDTTATVQRETTAEERQAAEQIESVKTTAQSDTAALRDEITALRGQLAVLMARLDEAPLDEAPLDEAPLDEQRKPPGATPEQRTPLPT